MATERPVCVYAMASLKRNSTRLLIVMCIGIALALYGVYVQARSQSNPSYTPTMAVATNWFYESFGQRLAHPARLLTGCASGSGRNSFKPSVGQLIMHRFIYPTMRYSGLMNGLINVSQIVILKLFSKSLTATDSIIGLSAVGIVISMLCLVGSFASCRLMCISCLGIHHVAIIYLAKRRRRQLKSILCPAENVSSSACTFGTGRSSTSGSGRSSTGNASGPPSSSNSNSGQASASKHASSCTTRRRFVQQ